MKKVIKIVLGICLLLTSCNKTDALDESSSFVTKVPLSSATVDPITSPFPTASPLPVDPFFSPTPDLRLPPERWQEWPIVPTISSHAHEIYQRGLAMGNNPQAFSKIGDCQNIPEAFLGIYDLSGRYSFTPDYNFLQESVDYYAGSFNRQGESVRGGFNAASVLSPLWANSEVCLPGENPIECENRINNPSVVIVSLEVWFSERTEDRYERYMRQIIEYNIEQGTLPILSTKADNVEGDHSINYIIAKLAYEYDLPLWNFWRAVQPLYNHGLDPKDKVSFHLSVDGWNMRSFTALQVLDVVMRGMEELPTEFSQDGEFVPSIPFVSFTPGPVSGLPYSQVEQSAPSVFPIASILLGISTRDGEHLESDGIFQGNLNGREWQVLAEAGFTLLDYSEFGALVMQNNELYVLKDNKRFLLTSQLRSESLHPAVWLLDGRVAAILHTNGQDQIVILTPDGGDPLVLPAASSPPLRLYPSPDPLHLYWGAGSCTDSVCEIQSLFVWDLEDYNLRALPYKGEPAFAIDGKMAFITYDADHNLQLTLVNGETIYTLPIPGNRVVDMS